MLELIIGRCYPKIIHIISNANIKKNENMSFEPYLHNDVAIINKEEVLEYGNGYGQFTYLDMQKMMFQNTYPKKPAKMIQTLPTICEDLDETNTQYNKLVLRQFMLFGMILTISGYIIIKGTYGSL